MRFGIGFPTFDPYSDPRLLADLAREAEDSAWDGCFVWDHIQAGWLDTVADPWVALTAITLATRRIRIGTLVTPLYRRYPWKLAWETVTLDHLSQGRLILGVGLDSDTFGEISAFGGLLDDWVRVQMFDEGLAVLTGLWSGESFSFSGEYFHINNARFIAAPVQQPRIPIWVAGTWPKHPPFRRASRYDGVIPVAGDVRSALSTAQVEELTAFIRQCRGEANTPYEIVYSATTPLASGHPDKEIVAAFAHAGAT